MDPQPGEQVISTTHLLTLFLVAAAAVLHGDLAHSKNFKFAAQDSPPFNYAVGTQIKGASFDIMTKVCEKLGWECQLEIVPQKRALTLAETGHYDGVWGILRLPEREKYLNYSSPTWTADLSFLGIKGRTKQISKESELKGFTILGVRSTASFKKAEELQAKIKNIKLVEANSYADAIDKLVKDTHGKKTVVAAYVEVGHFFSEERNIKDLVLILHVDDVQFRVGFSKKINPDVVAEFNKALAEMRRTGELKKILSSHGMTQ